MCERAGNVARFLGRLSSMHEAGVSMLSMVVQAYRSALGRWRQGTRSSESPFISQGQPGLQETSTKERQRDAVSVAVSLPEGLYLRLRVSDVVLCLEVPCMPRGDSVPCEDSPHSQVRKQNTILIIHYRKGKCPRLSSASL